MKINSSNKSYTDYWHLTPIDVNKAITDKHILLIIWDKFEVSLFVFADAKIVIVNWRRKRLYNKLFWITAKPYEKLYTIFWWLYWYAFMFRQ